MPAWRIAFLLTGLPGIPLAFLALLIAEPRAAAGRQNLAPSWRSVLDFMLGHKRFFAVQMLGFALVLGLAYVRLAWAPTFLMRTYGWSVAHVSYALASYGFVTGTLALLIGGRLVDFLYQRGLTDAHFRYYVAGGLILAVLGSASFLAPTPTWFFLLMLLPVFPLNMGAIGASAVQVVTPPELRGRVSAIYLLVIALIGMTLGPASVGLLTDRVLGRPGQIGIAMALVYGVCGLTVSALFLYGLPAMRRAAAAQSAGQEDPAPPR